MKCPRVEPLIALSLGLLDESVAQSLREHFAQCSECQQALSELQKEDEMLTAYHGAFDRGHPELRERLLGALATLTIRPAPSRGATWVLTRLKAAVLSRRMAAAATVVLAVVFIALLASNPFQTPSLYAQVMKKLQNIGTFHGVEDQWEDGEWVEHLEVWYDPDRGIRGDRQGEVVVEDGTYQWTYRPQERRVVRSRSQARMHEMSEFFLTEIVRELKEAKRDPSGDRTIDGVPCQLYVSSGPIITGVDSEGKSVYTKERSSWWFDKQLRPRVFEQEILREDGWEPLQRATLSYGIELDASLFTADFGPDVELFKQDEAVNELLHTRYSPEEALHSVEALGLVYYLHRVVRCDDGRILLIGSVRPTEETRRQSPHLWPERSWESYGTFQVGDRFATATSPGEGVFLDWSLREQALIRDGRLRVDVTMHPNSKLAEQTKGLYGEKSYFCAQFAVALPDEVTPLADVLDLIHKDLADFGAVGFYLEPFHARFQEKPSTNDRDWQVAPTRTELEEYLNRLIAERAERRPSAGSGRGELVEPRTSSQRQ